jgi:GT2 family glycosyltransferase
MKIAVLLATYNRKQKTLDCLYSLANQQVSDDTEVEIFLTDDASSDGTAELVSEHFPNVNLFSGTGTLFWAGGMRYTWQKALEWNADYYLLLNDDTLLEKNALGTLLQHSKYFPRPAICVGSTVDLNTGKTSYGGSKLTSKSFWKSNLMEAPTEFTKCDFANANIMLVPKEIVERIGILSNGYTHGLADYDYTLKASRAGFDVVIAPGFLGSCVDDHGNNWKSSKVSFSERVAYLKSPKGLAYSEYLTFIKSYFPKSYPFEFCKLWLKTLFPFVWDIYKK